MPEIDIFNANADAGFDEGWSEGSIAGEGNVTGLIEARFCHGIDLGVDIEASAAANAHLRLLVLGANASVGVSAHAGVRGQVTLDPNVFQRFGLTVRIEAAAELAATGRLDIALETEYIAELAAQELDGLAFDLFMAFLREARFGGGVYGKVAFSAMAKAWAEIAGTMSDDSAAGFTIGGGYAVGMEGGYGMDWYAKIGFENPRRFFNTSVNLIVDEIVDELQNQLPPGSDTAIELFRLLVPVGLNAAYDVGQKSITQGISSPTEIIQPFLTAFAEVLQQYLVEKATEYAAKQLSILIEEALIRLSGQSVSAQEQADVEASVRRLQDGLQDGKLNPEDINELMSLAFSICSIVSPEMMQRVRQPASILWTAITVGIALRDVGELMASGEISVLGIGAQATARIRKMPEISAMPPSVLQEYIQTVADFDGSSLTFDHAIDYLVSVGIGPILTQQAPEMSVLLTRLYQATGVSPGNIVTFGIQGAIGGSLGETELYQSLRDFTRSAVDDVVRVHLFAQFEQLSTVSSDAQMYMDEVAKPSIELMISFLFDQLDGAINQPSLLSNLDYLSTLQTGLSSLLYKIVARNLVVIEQVASNTVRAGTVTAMAQLEETVRSDQSSALMAATVDHVDEVMASISQYIPILPTATGLSDSQLNAVQSFVGEMLNIAQEALGDSVFTDARWNKRREAILTLMLSLDAHFNWSDTESLQSFIEAMKDCAFVPDEQAIQALFDVHVELLMEQAGIVLRRLPGPLGELILALTQAQFEELGRRAEEIANTIQEALNAARQTLENLIQSLESVMELARETLERVNSEMINATTAILSLNSATLKTALINMGRSNIRAAGEQLNIDDSVLNPVIDGFGAVLDLTFGITSPLIDTALNGIRSVNDFRTIAEDAIANISDSELLIAGGGDAFITDVTDIILDNIEQALLNLLPGDNNSALIIKVPIPGAIEVVAIDPISIARLITTELIERLDLDTIAATLLDAAYYAARQLNLEVKRNEQTINVDLKMADHEAIRSRDNTTIAVLSPLPLGDKADKFIAHGPIVPLSVVIDNAGASWGHHANSGRVQISANGKVLNFSSSAWHYHARRAELCLNTVIRIDTGSLKPGLNILEVSVSQGNDKFVRKVVEFLVDPNAIAPNTRFKIYPDDSQFDSPGNDHHHLDEEYVVFGYSGTEDVAMNGWRIRDASGHQYVFNNFSAKQGQKVKLHTGGNPDNDNPNSLFWGRKSAVWNNTGDSVILLDDIGNVRAQYSYRR